MPDLKTLLDQFLEKKAETEINPEDADVKIRAGVEANVRNAQKEIPFLERAYKEALVNHIVILDLNGSNADQFAKIANEKAGVVAIDFQEAKKEIIARVQSRTMRTTFTKQEEFFLMDELNKLKNEYDISYMPNLYVDTSQNDVFDKELEASIDYLLVRNYGQDLYSAMVLRKIQTTGMNAQFTGKLMPVMVLNLQDNNILPKSVASINCNKEISEEDVIEELDKVKKKLKKQK